MQSNNATIKYIHDEGTHNLQSPTNIVPFLVEKFKPASVIDVGCGIGTFLHVFKQQGVGEVLGVDGKWVNRSRLFIDEKEFMEADLESPLQINRSYDLVLCLEVAEHLSPAAAQTLVDNLTSLGKTIIFSAATDKQGGQNHLNEQPFSYWKEKFEKKGYKIIDFFRPVFWNNNQIQWWYKQNMFLIIHQSLDTQDLEHQARRFTYNELLIHPELYYERILEYEKRSVALQKLGAGEGGNFNFYLKLLFRSFKKTLKF